MTGFESNYQTNYQTNLEDTIELRKAVSKLEDLLTKKHLEYENLLNLYEDFKQLLEKSKKECKELNEKYITLYEDKKREERQHEMEIQKLKTVIKPNSSFMKDKRKPMNINF
jgi:hypothetical protein